MQTLDDTDTQEYYDNLLTIYYDSVPIDQDEEFKKEVFDLTGEGKYYNFGITEGLYKYWLKYYYPTVLNFTSFLAIYSGEELPYTMFENTTNTALNKTSHFIEEQSVEIVRNEMSIISEKDETIKFIWKAKDDAKTCKICNTLNNTVYSYKPNLAHPNCRCHLEIHKEKIER